MDEEIDIGSEMVEEEGIGPAFGGDDNQRAELLREWHREDAENEKENEDR